MTFKYDNVYIGEYAAVVGPMEMQGPLKSKFDKGYKDFYMGADTFEQAEQKLLDEALKILLKKRNQDTYNIDLLLGGDLLNQITSTGYVASKHKIPFIGLFSACSVFTESLSLASNMIEAKQINNAICIVSSHNLSSEKQFRYPTEYGCPKPLRSTFTSTGGVASYLSNKPTEIKITSSTIGKVIDLSIKDPFNMGAAMAPAVASTLNQHLIDRKMKVDDYDLILTGDLGVVGKEIFREYLAKKYKIKLKDNYDDCGTLLYDLKQQEVFSGGSGPACSPLVFFGKIVPKMLDGTYQKVLLLATGCLFSQTTIFQKMTMPSISHAISFEVIK